MKHYSPDSPPSPRPDLFPAAHPSYLDETGVNIDSDTAARLIVPGHGERHVTDITADIEHIQSAEPFPPQPGQARVQLEVTGQRSQRVIQSRLSQASRESS